jgi:predicted nuclease with TOPRIM domain
LKQSENRYETQRQARAPQNQERREQLAVMNRLQELARRQQDLNDRLKELQTALQEAKNETERDEIRRRLKRLQEEQRQMLADADEVRQRMDQADNQSAMNQQRQELDRTREGVAAGRRSLGGRVCGAGFGGWHACPARLAADARGIAAPGGQSVFRGNA